MPRPWEAASRLSMALMDLLEERGRPRSKISRVLNLHIVFRLEYFELRIQMFLPHGRTDLLHGIVERLLVDLFGADQVKAVGLLDRDAGLPLFQGEHGIFEFLWIAAVLFDDSKVAVLAGGGLIVGVFTGQHAE